MPAEDDGVRPLFASSIFFISHRLEVYQYLCYDYADPAGYYERVLHDEEAFAEEAERLRVNMETFLAEEKVYINGQQVQQKVIHVDIGLRGAADIPYIHWIIFFSGRARRGENSLASDVAEEKAPYDMEVLYLFPQGTNIKQVDTPMEYEVRGSLLLVWARRGDPVGGHEEVIFELPP